MPKTTICALCDKPIEGFAQSVHKGWFVHPSCFDRAEIMERIAAYEKRYDRKMFPVSEEFGKDAPAIREYIRGRP